MKDNESGIMFYGFNPEANSVSIKTKINALKDIRSSLEKERNMAPRIKKSKLQSIIDGAKTRYKNDLVSQEIDALFDEYLNKNKKELDVRIDSENDRLSLNDMNNMSGGASKVKRSSYFRASNDSQDVA